MKFYFFLLNVSMKVNYVAENKLNIHKLNKLFLVTSCFNMS